MMKLIATLVTALMLLPAHTLKEQLSVVASHFEVQLVYDANIENFLQGGCESSFAPDKSLQENLESLLAGTEVSWIVDGKYIVLKARDPKAASRLKNPSVTVSGYVKDRTSGETLIGAAVFNGTDGTVTNEYGYYSLRVPSGTNRIHFSHVGYDEKIVEVTATKDTVINVLFNPNLTIRKAGITAFSEAGLHSARPGSRIVSPEMIKSSPVVLGEADVLKTLQLLPGIQSGMEGFSGIYVRGGGPDENLIMLDGVPIYNVSHMFGLFSAFTPEAVKKVTVYTGAFPAKYGGRVSSVIDVRTNDGNSNELKGCVSVGLLSDKLHLEGPLGNGKTTFSASARAMHTFLLAPVMALSKNKINYLFYDLNGKLSHRFSDRDLLSLSIYNGKDRFRYDEVETRKVTGADGVEFNQTSEYDIRTAYGNTVAALRHSHIFTNNLLSEALVAWNAYGMDLFLENGDRTFDYSSGIHDLLFRDSFDCNLPGSSKLNFGAEYVFHRFLPEKSAVTIPDQPVNTYDGTRTDGHEASLFVSGLTSLSDRFTVEAGLRLTGFLVQGKGTLDIQPRASVNWMVSESVSLKAAYSRMSQYMHQLSSGSLSLPSDLWVPVTRNLKPEISDIVSAGACYTGLKDWVFSAEGYWKRLDNVIDYIDGKLALQGKNGWEDNVAMGRGRSYGVELYLGKTFGKTTGSLSYTLSRSERIFPDGSINNGRWFPFQYDRRHSITASFSHRFNERVDLGALWVFNSGNCMTAPEKMTEIIVPDAYQKEGFWTMEMWHFPSRNNYRLPPSHRLDLSVNIRKERKHGERVWTVGIYNLYNARNPNWVVVDYDSTDSSGVYHTCLSIRSFLTFLPYFSYTFNF
ncbi:MAG: TonB-dependent receptor domain-containing protein [Candidatus Cryptobacteroides sp.]